MSDLDTRSHRGLYQVPHSVSTAAPPDHHICRCLLWSAEKICKTCHLEATFTLIWLTLNLYTVVPLNRAEQNTSDMS